MSISWTKSFTSSDDGSVLTGAQIGTIQSDIGSGAGDVSAASVIGDNKLVRGDGVSKRVQKSEILVDDSDNITDVTSIEIDGAAPSPPLVNTLYKDNVINGWINFNGTGTIATNDSFNVTSISDDGVGTYGILWDRDFANAIYGVIISSLGDAASQELMSLDTTGVNIKTRAVAGTNSVFDSSIICVIAIGDQ